MTKTPYELRLDLLKIAQDQANQRFYNTWENARTLAENTNNGILLTEVPFPTSEEIIIEAEKLKNFIDKS